MLERKIPFEVKAWTMKILNNLRAQPLKDPRVQRVHEQWYENAPLIPSAIKDVIGLLYMTKVLGAKEKTVSKFTNGDRDAWLKIGSLHEGRSEIESDIKGFWEGVDKLVPGFISKKDLKYLIKVDEGKWGAEGAWSMIGVFNFVAGYDLATSSSVIGRLCTNSHAYAK